LKKLGIILALLLVASVFVSGCASNNGNVSNNETASSNASGAQGASAFTELNFGYQPSIHQVAYTTAAYKGWWKTDLAPYGVKDIKEYVFQTGPPEMQAMMAGDLDVAYVGAAPALTALSQGLDAKIVAAVQINGSSLVLSPGHVYKSPQDLKGLTIATYPPGSIQDTLLRKWLKENGLDPEKDVTIVGMASAGDAVTAIESGKVDAVFLPAPSPTSIERAGKGRIIVQSGQMEPDHVCCVLLMSGKLIRERPDIAEQVVKTHINATEYNKAHPDDAALFFANKTSSDVETVKAAIKEWDGEWITDPSLIENSTVDFSNTLYGLNYTKKPLTKDDIFDTSFYDKAVSENNSAVSAK
jgi:NitT/TauT family transport system substrate-binding protein